MNIELRDVNALVPYQGNARKHSKKQISQIARSIKDFGFINPILVDAESMVIAGHGRLMAAKELGLKEVPTLRIEHLDPVQKAAYILADNKLAQKSSWDSELIKIELENLLSLNVDFDLTLTGFETPEIDIILNTSTILQDEDACDDEAIPRVKKGELWQLGEHRVLCGDSLDHTNFERLLENETADLIFTDPPYNVAIDGNVCGHGDIKHDEFAYASGEMTEQQFEMFLMKIMVNLTSYSKDGSIHYLCMDWRHQASMLKAGQLCYTELKNICVWNKQVGGQGSLYRSQYENVNVFKNGKAPHTNNIELGKHGRNRTNIWDYNGVNKAGGHSTDLELHPTVKPIQLIADAIVDCSSRGDIVLDCFGGSGSTLLAAERTKRRARIIEYEPRYCDVIIQRFERMTGQKAICLEVAT